MGLTLLDASVVIGFLDASDRHHQGSTVAIREALANGDELALPLVAYAEVLVGALLNNGPKGRALVDDVLAALPARVIEASVEVGAGAAELRAKHRSLKLPDAFVLATAKTAGATRIITADRGWPKEMTAIQHLVAQDPSSHAASQD
ncbi:MAG: type II toxin-antitoxin system VapC family toxin [Candidatus Dormibacteria bacterium]